MRSARPYFLDLLRIRLAVGGFVSILHRVSGAVLALSVPVLLYVLMQSLRSEQGFANVLAWCHHWPGGLAVVMGVWAISHHLFAGLRHLGFDLGWGEERLRARHTAWLVLALSVALTLWAAAWSQP